MDCEKRIIAAVEKGNVEILTKLINDYGPHWQRIHNLLLLALQTKQLKAAKLILTQDWAFDITDLIIPLNLAASLNVINSIEIIEKILERGADINSAYKGKTPLHVAVASRCLVHIEFLLNHGANVNDVCTSGSQKGYTSLHFAAIRGSYKIINLIISKGANINAITEDGETPLHIAANLDYKKSNYQAKAVTAKLLLDKGAHIHRKRSDGLTPLLVSIKTRNEKVVSMLLENGANVDDQDSEGNTALYLGVEENSLPIVKDILQYCPSINIPSNRKSLINALRRRYRVDIVEALAEYGFTLNHEEANNAQLFHNAIWMGSFKLVKWFLKNGANPNGLDSTGNTPLHTAAKHRSKKFLIDYEPDIHAKNVNKAIGELLISYGADINAKNFIATTVIDYAIKKKNLELTKLLLTHGANVQDSVQLLVAPLHEDFEGFVEAIFPHCNINAILRSNKIEVLGLLKDLQTYRLEDEDVTLLINNDNIIDYLCEDTSKGRLSIFIKTLLYYGADVNILYENLYFYYGNGQGYVRLSDWPSYEHKFEELVGILRRHILQLKIANLYVNEQNLKLISQINEELDDFKNECKDEIFKMKNNQIINTGITFFNILGNNTNRLAKSMKNENILEALNLENYKTEYPIYARMIELSFIKAMKRKELVDQINLIFHFVFKYFYEFHKIPHHLTEEILDYLSDEDLQKLLLLNFVMSVDSILT